MPFRTLDRKSKRCFLHPFSHHHCTLSHRQHKLMHSSPSLGGVQVACLLNLNASSSKAKLSIAAGMNFRYGRAGGRGGQAHFFKHIIVIFSPANEYLIRPTMEKSEYVSVIHPRLTGYCSFTWMQKFSFLHFSMQGGGGFFFFSFFTPKSGFMTICPNKATLWGYIYV